MQKNNLILTVVILGLLFPALAFCETIILKSGKKIKGKILEKTDKYIKIEFESAPLYYELKYVKSIDEDKGLVTPLVEDASPKDVKFYFQEGFKYGSQAKFTEAERVFKKGAELYLTDHNLKETLKMIAALNAGTINREYAISVFKGSRYLVNGQYPQAIAEFKEALKIKPDDTSLYYYLGGCYYLLSEFSQAILYLEKTLKTNPDDAEVYGIIGTSHYLLGDIEEARDNLTKARVLFAKDGDYLKVKELDDILSKLK